MVEVTEQSKYMDLLNAYPLFKFLVTPMGKISLWEANLREVSESAEMSVDETVSLFQELIDSY